MSVQGKTVVVTGGSRGLGLGLVEVLAEKGAKVTVVARDPDALEAARRRFDVDTISADIGEEGVADRILSRVKPDVLALNAGAIPPMGRLDQLSWADFSAPWQTDVKAGFHWIQAALRLPLSPGARVLVGSSGAAVQGSPMSGGYAGAKRTLWLMAKYANGVAAQNKLNIRFQAIAPQQIVGGTGVGDEAASVYAKTMGLEPGAFLARFGAPLPPRTFGELVVAILENPDYLKGVAFGLKGDSGITLLESDAS